MVATAFRLIRAVLPLPRPKLLSRGVTAAVVLTLAAPACGSGYGSSSSTPTSPSPAPAPAPSPAPAPAPAPARVTITSTGASPNQITIAVGSTVTFVNNDTTNHDILGGPDLEHRDCPEIDAVGFLTPGQSRQTQAFTMARACDYHDHVFHTQTSIFNGRIIIQ